MGRGERPPGGNFHYPPYPPPPLTHQNFPPADPQRNFFPTNPYGTAPGFNPRFPGQQPPTQPRITYQPGFNPQQRPPENPQKLLTAPRVMFHKSVNNVNAGENKNSFTYKPENFPEPVVTGEISKDFFFLSGRAEPNLLAQTTQIL